MKISLAQMKADHKGEVIEISGGTNLRGRLMNMGVHKDKEVTELSYNIGLQGPVVIKAGRSYDIRERGRPLKNKPVPFFVFVV